MRASRWFLSVSVHVLAATGLLAQAPVDAELAMVLAGPPPQLFPTRMVSTDDDARSMVWL